jgi:tetratricopeptide (TPR) repeat protein
MLKYSFPKISKSLTTTIFILTVTSFLFAQEVSGNRGYIGSGGIPEAKKGTVIFKEGLQAPGKPSLQEEKNLTELQKEARQYRTQGLEFQNMGNLDAAMALYQKAIILDPAYAAAHNDLGVIYEARGYIDRAEESYLQAIKLDSNFLSAYSNLALLYETKRDLAKAACYWKKRAELGVCDDPWTQKAKQRLEDINLVLLEKPQEAAREKETLNLLSDVSLDKDLLKKDDKALAKKYFEDAKSSYQKGNEVSAYKLALDAKQLDPANSEIEGFIEKVQKRLLSQ